MVFSLGLVPSFVCCHFILFRGQVTVRYFHKPNLNPKHFTLSSIASDTGLTRQLWKGYSIRGCRIVGIMIDLQERRLISVPALSPVFQGEVFLLHQKSVGS